MTTDWLNTISPADVMIDEAYKSTWLTNATELIRVCAAHEEKEPPNE